MDAERIEQLRRYVTVDLDEVELDELLDAYQQRAALKARVERLRKALNWLIGALENAPDGACQGPEFQRWRNEVQAWEIKRGRAVLEEESLNVEN
jgi:hypothetical protein